MVAREGDGEAIDMIEPGKATETSDRAHQTMPVTYSRESWSLTAAHKLRLLDLDRSPNSRMLEPGS